MYHNRYVFMHVASYYSDVCVFAVLNNHDVACAIIDIPYETKGSSHWCDRGKASPPNSQASPPILGH